MNKISKKRSLLFLIIPPVLFFLFFKVSTNIYIDHYSYFPYIMDLEVKIDDKLIFNDSLYGSLDFPTIVKEELSYGFHKISVSSNKVNVYQQNKVFLLPNQYIYIDFYATDTLYDYRLLEKHRDVLFLDSVFQNINKRKIIRNPKSFFRIESSFNPSKLNKKLERNRR